MPRFDSIPARFLSAFELAKISPTFRAMMPPSVQTETHPKLAEFLNPKQLKVTVYIVAFQRGGVSDQPPWLWAATRHGPGTL